MQFGHSHFLFAGLNLLYLIPFSIVFISQGNYEFVAYAAQVLVIGVLILATLHRTRFSLLVLALLSLWSLMHMAGGGVLLQNGEVLYRLVLVDLWRSGDDVILKYDQIVHFFGFFVATLASYELLAPQLRVGARIGVVAFVAVMAGMGFGALNEVVEFIAYAVLPSTGVGGYLNTALDLVSNGLGAIVAGVGIVLWQRLRA